MERPVAAFILSLIGGLLVFLGGIALFFSLEVVFGGIREVFVVLGPILVFGAIAMYVEPRFSNVLGVVTLILGFFSLVGIITASGGVLLMVGGYLATTWKNSAGEVERHHYRFRYNV